jgi:hypothetical protein
LGNGCGTYREPARDTPVLGEYDVVVAGGGPSGCAAATAAARQGVDTLLVEKDGYLGGATVSQFVMPVLSMNGVDFQGLWHEWMRVLQRLDGVGDLRSRRGRYADGSVDPEGVKRAWDELLAEAGAQLLHHVLVAGAIVDGGAIRGLLLETKAGRRVVLARCIVDCTGDGLVCDQAGVPWEQGDGTSVYAMACTKPFRLGNARMPEGFPTSEHLKGIDRDYQAAMDRDEYTDPIITQGRIVQYLKAWTRPLANRPEMLVGGPSRILNINALDPWDVTRAEREARAQIWQVQDYYRKYLAGCEDSYFLDSSNQIGVRSTRRVHGLARVTKEDVFGFGKHADGIARSSWHVDVWPHDSYTKGANAHEDREWMARLRAGDYFDIRYGCLVAKGVDNLLMAGRCISADHWAQSSLRIQQTCIATGQAAGVAAALSVKDNTTPRELGPLRVVAQLAADRAAVEPFEGLKECRHGT